MRSAYVEQLRDRGIISTYFIPNILDLLRLPEGIARAFKLDAWAVDEFYVQCSYISPFLAKACVSHDWIVGDRLQ